MSCQSAATAKRRWSGRQATDVARELGVSKHTIYAWKDNLLTVVQNGSRNRSFSYDPLSRPTSATNPESGTINYTYDANGDLSTKVEPAPNQTAPLPYDTRIP